MGGISRDQKRKPTRKRQSHDDKHLTRKYPSTSFQWPRVYGSGIKRKHTLWRERKKHNLQRKSLRAHPVLDACMIHVEAVGRLAADSGESTCVSPRNLPSIESERKFLGWTVCFMTTVGQLQTGCQTEAWPQGFFCNGCAGFRLRMCF